MHGPGDESNGQGRSISQLIHNSSFRAPRTTEKLNLDAFILYRSLFDKITRVQDVDSFEAVNCIRVYNVSGYKKRSPECHLLQHLRAIDKNVERTQYCPWVNKNISR
jgi:hypothetical protein